jgi:hypothetical protein
MCLANDLEDVGVDSQLYHLLKYCFYLIRLVLLSPPVSSDAVIDEMGMVTVRAMEIYQILKPHP